MSVDNRTEINDCDSSSGWQGDGGPNATSLAGQFYEGTAAIQGQHSDSDEESFTNDDSTGTAFSIDLSDATVYFMLKDNLNNTYANGGIQLVLGETTADRAGYDIGGSDAPGVDIGGGFRTLKGDGNSIDATPGGHTVYVGTEANIDFTAIDSVGYGSLHNAKAQGNVANWVVDRITYMANDSYALTINGGTSGTPETMADVRGDDETNGWGMIGNPFGDLYYFAAPTEWGEATANAAHYFEATGEQWFWIGDNGGGRALGATHFPFRVIGNATDTGSFKIAAVTVVNTGTSAEFDCSSTNVNTLEISGCSFTGLANFSAPQSGGTSRFVTDTIFADCGQIIGGTSVCDFSGCSFLTSTVAADEGAFYDNRTTTTSTSITELTNTTFSQGTNAHHAIRFGTGVDDDITLTGIEFTGFSSSDDVNGSTLRFDATTGSMNVNLVNCTVDGNPATTSNVGVDDAAGITVTLVIDPKTTKVTCENQAGSLLQNVRVFLETDDNGGGSGFPYQAGVSTLTQTGGTATLTASAAHGLATGDYVVVRGANDEYYNKTAQITVTSTTAFTYSVNTSAAASAGGTPVFSYCPISGTTNSLGVIQSAKAWPASQGLKGWARKSTTSPYYKQSPLSIADASGGTDLLVLMIGDE